MKKIVQITGEARVGKSTVSKRLADEFGATRVLISDIIGEYAKERGMTLEQRADYLAAHRQLKLERGADIIAKTVLATPADRIIVDGIRVPSDVNRLRHAGPDVGSRVIALVAPAEVRFIRAQQNRSPKDPQTLMEFTLIDEQEGYAPDQEQQNTYQVISEADHRINASDSPDYVYESVRGVVAPFFESQG